MKRAGSNPLIGLTAPHEEASTLSEPAIMYGPDATRSRP